MRIITETPRLVLREFDLSDAKDFYELNADAEVIRYTGDSGFSSLAEAELFLRNYSDYQGNGYGRWAVITKEGQRFVGWCGLKLNEEDCVDLGFRFFKREWGKGYATESAKAALEYGFDTLGINEIIGRAAVANPASVRVLEKLGMQLWKNAPCLGIEEAVYYRLNRERHILLILRGNVTQT